MIYSKNIVYLSWILTKNTYNVDIITLSNYFDIIIFLLYYSDVKSAQADTEVFLQFFLVLSICLFLVFYFVIYLKII